MARRFVVSWMFVALYFFALAFSPRAVADEGTNPGVWEGTIGKQEVVACFNSEFPSGSYYYKRILKPIGLRPEQDGVWVESGSSGHWELQLEQGSSLTGWWHGLKEGKRLPIQLERVKDEEDGRACARDAFNRRIEGRPAFESGAKKVFAPGHIYRSIRFAGQETIELFGPEPAIDQVNRQLRRTLPLSSKAIKDYFQERREQLGRSGSADGDETSAKPTYWSGKWLSVEFYLWAAGTGRRGISLTYRTWNTETAKETDLWEWLGLKSVDGTDMGYLTPKLKKALLAGIETPNECKAGYYSEGGYHLTLEPTGMRFWENADGDGCDKDVLIPYQDLFPLLSAKGRLAVSGILGVGLMKADERAGK